jgi:hypothetical protein
MDGLMDYLTEEQKLEFKPVPIEMKKGMVLSIIL